MFFYLQEVKPGTSGVSAPAPVTSNGGTATTATTTAMVTGIVNHFTTLPGPLIGKFSLDDFHQFRKGDESNFKELPAHEQDNWLKYALQQSALDLMEHILKNKAKMVRCPFFSGQYRF